MKRENIIYLALVALLLVLYFMVQSSKTVKGRNMSWSPSFSNQHDRPFGTQLIFDRLRDIFPESEIQTIQKSTYLSLSDTFFWEETAYIVINNSFQIDRVDTDKLLEFVDEGNHALIAAESFSPFLADSLGFSGRTSFLSFSRIRAEEEADSNRSNFFDPSLADSAGYNFFASNMKSFFSQLDSNRTEVLAYNNEGFANLIRIPWGDGSFVLCSAPYLLTNYHLLYNNHHDFIAKTFSLIPPESNILWDEYYKVEFQRSLATQGGGSGDLSYILGEPELAWAWYLGLFSLILFVFIERKRKQRIIPIVKPHPNLTVDFVQTIGRLYFQSQNHKNIAEKKIKVFLEYIRSRYFLKTHQIDLDFVHSLSGKSNIDEGDLRALFNLILKVKKQPSITEERLVELNQMIDDFYERSPR